MDSVTILMLTVIAMGIGFITIDKLTSKKKAKHH